LKKKEKLKRATAVDSEENGVEESRCRKKQKETGAK
jgi:hypothetical protein